MEALDALAVDACVAVLGYLHAAKSAGLRAEIDLPRLTSWFESQRGPVAREAFADAAATRSCLTYENYYKTVCAAAERTDGGYDDRPLIVETRPG